MAEACVEAVTISPLGHLGDGIAETELGQVRVSPVDQFLFSPHIEAVAQLSRKP